MSDYQAFTSIELQGIFTNTMTGVYADPTSITLYILDPNGVATTQIWPAGNVVRDSTGHFHFIMTPTVAGLWLYKWRGTGTLTATSPDTQFNVLGSSVALTGFLLLEDGSGSLLLEDGSYLLLEN